MKNRGFSIVEVMFAIMILGIGFIMVAAMFPVAIQQSQANVDESTGRSVAASGAMQTANAFRSVLPADQPSLTTMMGTVCGFERIAELIDPVVAKQRDLINSSVIYQGDPRFGWTSFYQYDPANLTKTYSIITVALRARNIAEQLSLSNAIGYSGHPFAFQTGVDAYDNASVRCRVNFIDVPGAPGRILINTGAGDPNPVQAPDAAVEGAIVIVRAHSDAAVVGRVYYLSEYDRVTGEWELDPRSNALPTANLTGVEAYLLGRGLEDPNAEWDTPAGTNPRTGLSQVVGVYRMTSALP